MIPFVCLLWLLVPFEAKPLSCYIVCLPLSGPNWIRTEKENKSKSLSSKVRKTVYKYDIFSFFFSSSRVILFFFGIWAFCLWILVGCATWSQFNCLTTKCDRIFLKEKKWESKLLLNSFRWFLFFFVFILSKSMEHIWFIAIICSSLFPSFRTGVELTFSTEIDSLLVKGEMCANSWEKRFLHVSCFNLNGCCQTVCVSGT